MSRKPSPGSTGALRLYRDLGDDVSAARPRNHLPHAALGRNEVVGAQHLARDALASLAALAAVAAARSEGETRRHLAGAAAATRESIAARTAPFDVEIPAGCST